MWECGTGTEGAFRSFVLSHSQAAFSRRHRRRRRLAVQLASEDRSRSPNVADRRSRRGRRSKSNDANAVKESLHAFILGDSFEQANTGLSKRNGAKLRESFCPAAASHSRPRQASA